MEHALSIYFAIEEVSLEDTALADVHAFAVGLSVKEFAHIPALVWIVGFAIAIWHVVLPLPLVLVPTDIMVSSLSICFISLYFSFVVAPICLNNPSLSLALSIYKSTLQVVSIIEVEFA